MPESPCPPATPEPSSVPAHRRQVAIQFAALFGVLSLAWPYYGLRGEPLPWPETGFVIGAAAFALSCATRQAWWWRIIHLIFAPLSCIVAALSLPPGAFLLAFGLTFMVYRGAVAGRIPLYLSNNATARCLSSLPDFAAGKRMLDLGAGIGSIVRPIAYCCPQMHITGIENAPATWLIGRLRTLGLANCRWQWGNLWGVSLEDYDIVYAFLSPAPMADLWSRVTAQMRPGSLFISNSFPVPGIDPSEVIVVEDTRETHLYLYRR